ncbi:MAG TPA: hypothetical protein VMV10_19410 [Pirellulales bacterium]|nr:hypothetical protein [Pirellulales bacterium]
MKNPTVVKLGGSLLDLADLAPRLRDWLARQRACSTVLVAGGGRMADVVRDADRLHRLGETASHWLCIRVMTINAELLAALLPEASLCRSLADWRSPKVDEASCLVLDPWLFLHEEEPQVTGQTLPESWQVTSDSIAARFAAAIGAAELVLLKSALPEATWTLADAAAAGYVDEFLPRLADATPQIRCVNLRAAGFPQSIWQHGSP